MRSCCWSVDGYCELISWRILTITRSVYWHDATFAIVIHNVGVTTVALKLMIFIVFYDRGRNRASTQQPR